MGRTSSERSTPIARHPRPLKLHCPECTHDVPVERDALIDGLAVQCQHCGSEAELAQEFDEATATHHWVLIDPLADYDEADARRN